MKHKHHILPRHAGGSDDPSNIIEVSPTQHAMWHYANWQLWCRPEDKCAWLGLAGYSKNLEFIQERCRLGGRIRGPKLYEEGRGIWAMSPEAAHERSVKAGKITGEKFKREKLGVCGIPPEEHSARMSNTNRQRWKCPQCEYTGIARQVNAHMLSEHGLPKSAKVKCVILLKE